MADEQKAQEKEPQQPAIVAAQPPSSYPYFYSQPGAYYSAPPAQPRMKPSADDGKKAKRVPDWAKPIIIVAVVLAVFFAGITIAITTLPNMTPGPSTETVSYDVIVGSGGFYKYTVFSYYYGAEDIKFNASSEGGEKFDIYIMQYDQFENFYGSLNKSAYSFSALYKSENRSQFSGNATLPDGYGDAAYLIIDNLDNPLTGNDAVPASPISVHFSVTRNTSSVDYLD